MFIFKSFFANTGPQPVWRINSSFQAIRIAAGANYQMYGVVIDEAGTSLNCSFINGNNNSWSLNLTSEIWYMPSSIKGLYIEKNSSGAYSGYYQDANWNNVNIVLEPFTNSGILKSITERIYSIGGSDMISWTGPISNLFSVCGNDSSQYNLTNKDIRLFAQNNPGSYGFIDASYKTIISKENLDTKSWMTILWDTIKIMPAREFLFPGCHDALASYGGTGEGYGHRNGFPTGLSYDQDRTITAMLNDGCRFFDLRFENEWGHHSSVNFNVTQTDVVKELATFFTASNANEIVVINLDIRDGSSNPSQTTLTNLYQGFVDLLTQYGNNIIFPIAFNSQDANPSCTLDQLRTKGNIIFMVNSSIFEISGIAGWNPPSNIFWKKQYQDAVSGYGDATSASDYYNDIIENGYITNPIEGNIFNYLSLTSTGGHIGNSNNDFAQAMNGPMADWILNATELNNSMLSVDDSSLNISSSVKTILQSNGYQHITLPFKTTQTGGNISKNRNFNLISVNFYEKGPFIINAIAQNIISAIYIGYTSSIPVPIPIPVPTPVNPIPQFGSLQNKSNKAYRTSRASQLDSSYNNSCKLEFISYGTVYAIKNVSNGGYYQDSITHLASSVSGDDQKWSIIPTGITNEYYIRNVANKGYMTSSASQLSGTAGVDEVWIIQSR